MPLSPLVKTGGAAGERFVSLAASRLLVRSINKSRAIVVVGLSNVIACAIAAAAYSDAVR